MRDSSGGVCDKCKAHRTDLVDVGGLYYCRKCIGETVDSANARKNDLATRRREVTWPVNLLFFILFGVPLGLSFLGFCSDFSLGFLSMIHEMGHFLVLMLDMFVPFDLFFFMLLAGGFTECFLPFLSFAVIVRDRRFFVVACLFLAVAGTALIDTGRYMASSLNPQGVAFISNDPMTYENHDWFQIFSMLGILEYSGDIAGVFYIAGYFVQYLGFYTALVGFVYSRRRLNAFLFGMFLALVYALLIGMYHIALLYVFAGIALAVYIWHAGVGECGPGGESME